VIKDLLRIVGNLNRMTVLFPGEKKTTSVSLKLTNRAVIVLLKALTPSLICGLK